MVQRLTSTEAATRLRAWFRGYMLGQDDNRHRASKLEGFRIGPSQLCRQANVDYGVGSRLFGDGKSAKKRPYVPLAEYLRRLTVALRDIWEERGYEGQKPTIVRAFIEAGYLTEEDVREFLEVEGFEGWMKEADCLGEGGGLDLRKLDETGRLVVREMYNFQLLRIQPGEEVSK